MTLTAKQEAFAQAIADGMNQSDAYRTAYNPKPMTDNALHVRAHEVGTNSNVLVRVAELQKVIADKHLWTREDSVKALRSVADKDDAKGAEIVAAIKELNSMHGFNAPVKHELKAEVVSRIELVPMSGD